MSQLLWVFRVSYPVLIGLAIHFFRIGENVRAWSILAYMILFLLVTELVWFLIKYSASRNYPVQTTQVPTPHHYINTQLQDQEQSHTYVMDSQPVQPYTNNFCETAGNDNPQTGFPRNPRRG